MEAGEKSVILTVEPSTFELRVFEMLDDIPAVQIDKADLNSVFTDYYYNRRRIASYNKKEGKGILHYDVAQEILLDYERSIRANKNVDNQ